MFPGRAPGLFDHPVGTPVVLGTPTVIPGVGVTHLRYVVQPRLAGHGPTLFAGLSQWIDLKLVNRLELRSGGGGDAV